jgi:DNA-binding XRE family transcriptional regulator
VFVGVALWEDVAQNAGRAGEPEGDSRKRDDPAAPQQPDEGADMKKNREYLTGEERMARILYKFDGNKAALARTIGVTLQNVDKTLSGSNPKLATLCRIAEALNVPVDVLIYR